MAAKQHTTWIGWASDHWFLTFLIASSAISLPVALINAAKPAPPPGPSPFPSREP